MVSSLGRLEEHMAKMKETMSGCKRFIDTFDERFDTLCRGEADSTSTGMVTDADVLVDAVRLRSGNRETHRSLLLPTTWRRASSNRATVEQRLGALVDQLVQADSATISSAARAADHAPLRCRMAPPRVREAGLICWMTTGERASSTVSARAKHPDDDNSQALGLLNLYGFEVFSSVGFEQFLNNCCNERLQQFFVGQVVTSEAGEYAAETVSGIGSSRAASRWSTSRQRWR